MTNWNELRDRAYKTACEHGFHDEEMSDEHYLCLVISELMEAVQADRKGKRADMEAYEKYNGRIDFIENFERQIKDTVEDELSDVCIRIFDLAGLRGINLNSAIKYTYFINKSKFTEIVYDIVADITNDAYTIGDRLYSALSKVFALADFLDIYLLCHIKMKMKYNETREYKNGRKY